MIKGGHLENNGVSTKPGDWSKREFIMCAEYFADPGRSGIKTI